MTGKRRRPEPENPTIEDVIKGRYTLSVLERLLLGFIVVGSAFALLVGIIVGVQTLLGWS